MPDRYDVAILGGGLAGLTVGLQLKKALPETSILIAEKQSKERTPGVEHMLLDEIVQRV